MVAFHCYTTLLLDTLEFDQLRSFKYIRIFLKSIKFEENFKLASPFIPLNLSSRYMVQFFFFKITSSEGLTMRVFLLW